MIVKTNLHRKDQVAGVEDFKDWLNQTLHSRREQCFCYPSP
jgi:hypothetical protein